MHSTLAMMHLSMGTAEGVVGLLLTCWSLAGPCCDNQVHRQWIKCRLSQAVEGRCRACISAFSPKPVALGAPCAEPAERPRGGLRLSASRLMLQSSTAGTQTRETRGMLTRYDMDCGSFSPLQACEYSASISCSSSALKHASASCSSRGLAGAPASQPHKPTMCTA